jgi:hypothetical protein
MKQHTNSNNVAAIAPIRNGILVVAVLSMVDYC